MNHFLLAASVIHTLLMVDMNCVSFMQLLRCICVERQDWCVKSFIDSLGIIIGFCR